MKYGIAYDFELGDIVIGQSGAFKKAYVDSQICALIACSEVCRITKPEVGARIAGRLQNVPINQTRMVLSEGERMVTGDGGREVSIRFVGDQLEFIAEYGN